MLKDQRLPMSVAGLGAVVLVGYAAYWLLGGTAQPSPDELAATALAANDPNEGEQSAAQLIAHPDTSLATLRQVWREASLPEVRAVAAVELGARRDWEIMPELIEGMRSESVQLRGRSAQAVNLVVGEDFGFNPRASEQQRQQVIAVIEGKWKMLHEGYLAKQRLLESGERLPEWNQTSQAGT